MGKYVRSEEQFSWYQCFVLSLSDILLVLLRYIYLTADFTNKTLDHFINYDVLVLNHTE